MDDCWREPIDQLAKLLIRYWIRSGLVGEDAAVELDPRQAGPTNQPEPPFLLRETQPAEANSRLGKGETA